MEEISKVYVQTNEQSQIIRCEGGITTPSNLDGWTLIDQGTGDKYLLCQSHYFEGGLYTQDGYPRYKLSNGTIELRTEAELEADLLPDRKQQKITESKQELEQYLMSHPLQWTDGSFYSITEEKQNQLMGTLVAAQLDGKKPEWNTTGGVCKEWELEELTALAISIKNKVKELVKYQQTKELEIQQAGTLLELKEIEVDYDTVE